MKYISLFLAAVFTLSNGYCFDGQKIDSCGKTYVQPNQISFVENSLFVFLNNAWCATEAIYTDASGVYVTNVGDNQFFGWECPKCGFKNSSFDNACQKCGHR